MKNLITCLTVSVLSSAAIADTWTVDDDGVDFPQADFSDIQSAVDAAAFNGDEVLVYPGTYTSTSSEEVIAIPWGKNIWIHSVAGASVTTIDGENIKTGVSLPGGVLEGFTITNCSAGYGAGIKAFGGPVIKNCVVSGNYANDAAGGIYFGNKGFYIITNTTIEGNSCGIAGGSFGHGAGVYIGDSSTVSFDGCLIQDNINTQQDGGGVYIAQSVTATFNDCVVRNNSATVSGGGIYNASAANTTLSTTTICGNIPNNIHGLWSDEGDVCVSDSCVDTDANGIPDGCDGLPDGLYVPSEYATIQLAIDAAVIGDTIYVDAGTWTGSGSSVINTMGKAITVESVLGAGVTIIDAEGVRRGVEILNGESDTTIIKGFTVIGGTASEGGGIFCSNSSPQFINCVVIGNETTGDYPLGGGGGICLRQSDAAVIGCTISDNEALGDTAFGGGIFCREGNPTITDCVISNNAGSIAGGLSCFISNTIVSDCTISGNDATDPNFGDGGGIQNYGGNLQILNCSVTNNVASWGGGGFGMLGGGTTVITSSTFDSNTARQGGGLYPGGDVTIQDCTISNNVATHIGGGTMLWSGVTITNSTFESNDAGLGGAMYCSGSPEIRDCTISGNTSWAGGGIWAGGGASPQLINCVLQNNSADVLASSAIYSHDKSVITLTDCSLTSNLLDGGEVFANFSAAVIFLGTCESESMNAVSGSSLLFGPDSTCDVSGSIIPSLEGSISFDIDDLVTTASVSIMGLLQKQGCLRVSNDSGSLTSARIGDVIPLAEAWYVSDDFDSIVMPSMPDGLGLKVVERSAMRGPNVSIELEVIEIEEPTFSNPFQDGLDSPPVDIVSFDADGDGADEIAVLFGGSPGGVATYSVSEDGAPIPLFELTAIVGNSPISIDAGDINGDGYDDLMVTNSSDNSLTVLLTSGVAEGSLYFDTSIVAVSGSNQSVSCGAIINWDGDDDLDAVVGVDLADPNMEDAYQVMLDLSSSPSSGTRFDIPKYLQHDGNYVADPPTSVDGGKPSSFVGGTRYGRIHRAITDSNSLDVLGELSGNNVVSIESVDLDDGGGDGQLDLMVASDEGESIYLFQGDIAAVDGFGDLIPLAVSEEVKDIVAFDADFDGDMDLVMTAPNSANPLILLRNDGTTNLLSGGLEGRTWSKQNINSTTPVTRLASGGLSPKDDEDDWVVGGGSSTAFRGEVKGVLEQTNIRITTLCTGDFNSDSVVDVNDLLVLIAAWGLCDACPEDINADGIVDVNDLLLLIAAWGSCDACPEDLNADGEVDVNDLLLVIAAWGVCEQIR
jgi:hypothetical protein